MWGFTSSLVGCGTTQPFARGEGGGQGDIVTGEGRGRVGAMRAVNRIAIVITTTASSTSKHTASPPATCAASAFMNSAMIFSTSSSPVPPRSFFAFFSALKQGLGFEVCGLGFRVWGLGFGVWGLGFGIWGLGFGDHLLAVFAAVFSLPLPW